MMVTHCSNVCHGRAKKKVLDSSVEGEMTSERRCEDRSTK
jgi:hypothetical protein